MDKLWNRNYILLFFINFLTTIIFFLLIVSMSDYALRTFDISTAVAGFISSIFLIGAIFGRLVSGHLVNQLGAKKILHLGLIVFLVGIVLYFFDFSIVILLITRFIHGAATGVIGTAASTLILLSTSPKNRASAISYFALSTTLAMAIGPFIGVMVSVKLDSFGLLTVINLICTLVCLLLYYLLRIDNQTFAEKGASNKLQLKQFVILSSPVLVGIVFFIAFSYSTVLSFITVYVQEINLLTAGSYFYIVFASANFIFRPILMKLIHANRYKLVYTLLTCSFALGMLILSQSFNSVTLLCAAACIGLGYGGILIFIQIQLTATVEPHQYSVITSTFFIFLNIGLGVGPYLLGLLQPFIGYRMLYICMIPIILATTFVYRAKYASFQKEHATQ